MRAVGCLCLCKIEVVEGSVLAVSDECGSLAPLLRSLGTRILGQIYGLALRLRHDATGQILWLDVYTFVFPLCSVALRLCRIQPVE